MSSAIAPPANQYISLFDFRLVFDLTDGTIKIDLSPSLITDGSGIYAGVQIVRPDKVSFSDPGAFTPVSYNTVYRYNLPRVQKVYMWGLYTVTCTLIIDTIPYPLTKVFNLCAVNTKDPYATEGAGVITLAVDCAMGTLTARGFCGYAYKGMPPVDEAWNITRYYPPEAELLPQKNLTVIPFVADAYQGVNTVKGVNTSTYDFGDNVFVLLRIVAAAEKNVRCGMDMDQIYCGMKSLLDTLAACNGTAKDYVQGFAEINALLWTTTAGLSAGQDVSAEIDRLETLLGVDCRCAACAGEKVGPTCVPECPTVASANAIVDTTSAQLTLMVSFNTGNMAAGSSVNIKYRPFCDPATNEAWADQGNIGINAQDATVTTAYNITEPVTYQVMLTSVMSDGTECDAVVIQAPGNCPQVVDINQPPPPGKKVRVDWGWDNKPFSLTRLTDKTKPDYWAAYQRNKLVDPTADVSVEFKEAPDLLSYIVLRYPKSAGKRLNWNNTRFNYGQIPDQVFETGEDGDYYYAWSRVKPVLNVANNKTITFSI